MDDNDDVNLELARTYLLARMPRPPAGQEPTDLELDEEVRVLIAIGRYQFDRWAAEAEARRSGLKATALKRKAEFCSGLHFNTLQNEAVAKLRAYVERNDQGVVQLADELSSRMNPKLTLGRTSVWILLQGATALVGILTIALVAGLISLLSQTFREEAQREITSLFNAPASSERPAPPASGAPAPAVGNVAASR